MKGKRMFKHKYVDILSAVEVFNGLTRDDLKILAKKCQKVTFKKNDMLMEEGQVGTAFYILTQGQLKVFLPEEIKGRSEDRISDVKLNYLKAGDSFGDYSLIANMPASASIIASQSGEMIRIPANDFKDFLKLNDRIAKTIYHNLLCALIKRLRKREGEYDAVLIVR